MKKTTYQNLPKQILPDIIFYDTNTGLQQMKTRELLSFVIYHLTRLLELVGKVSHPKNPNVITVQYYQYSLSDSYARPVALTFSKYNLESHDENSCACISPRAQRPGHQKMNQEMLDVVFSQKMQSTMQENGPGRKNENRMWSTRLRSEKKTPHRPRLPGPCWSPKPSDLAPAVQESHVNQKTKILEHCT